MVTITNQYCRFCGSTFDTHHIGDPLIWVARVVGKLCNCRWKYRLKTFFEDERYEKFCMAGLYGDRWSNDSWSVLTPFILEQIDMNRTACLLIWKQHSVIRHCWYSYSNYIWFHFGNKRNNTLCQLRTSLTFSPAKGWDFCCKVVIFLPHALSESAFNLL